MVTDTQVRKLMQEYERHGRKGRAARAAGMSRTTARRYMGAGKLPSEMRRLRTWRTREDPFAEDWSEIAERLEAAPELEAKTLFEDLCERHPGWYQEGQLRTFQRRVREWRALSGPPKRLFFAQEHRPGDAMQTDFTWCTELRVTIQGEPFSHQLCHQVLPYSNWEWGTVCQSESLLAIRRGLQSALFRLGRAPKNHQTDNSTAATHSLADGKRGFNAEYVAVVEHFGMKPRTTMVGEKEQDGDIEAANGALKRRLEQHLLLRGSRDFASVEEWEAWVQEVIVKANRGRSERLAEEMRVMRQLDVARLPEYREMEARVNQGGMIRVKNNGYSMPSRLKGERVRVRVYERRLEAYFKGKLQATFERLRGEGRWRVDYRHVIDSMVDHPGAFELYRYRDALFPREVFRRAHEAMCGASNRRWRTDLEYLRIVQLAAREGEQEVAAALELLLGEGAEITSDAVRELVTPPVIEAPALAPLEADLGEYDVLHRAAVA